MFDDEERRVFERVVVVACGGTVSSRQIAALVSDLDDQMREDGVSRRALADDYERSEKEASTRARSSAWRRFSRRRSSDVSAVEREVLTKIATTCGLEASDVDAALADVRAALASPA